MSSISVSELISHLQSYPDDYEVIMDWKWKEYNQAKDEVEQKHSIAFINGIERNDGYREVRLMN